MSLIVGPQICVSFSRSPTSLLHFLLFLGLGFRYALVIQLRLSALTGVDPRLRDSHSRNSVLDDVSFSQSSLNLLVHHRR